MEALAAAIEAYYLSGEGDPLRALGINDFYYKTTPPKANRPRISYTIATTKDEFQHESRVTFQMAESGRDENLALRILDKIREVFDHAFLAVAGWNLISFVYEEDELEEDQAQWQARPVFLARLVRI